MKKKQLIAILFSLIFATTGVSAVGAKEISTVMTKGYVQPISESRNEDKQNAESISFNTKNKFTVLAKEYFNIQWSKFTMHEDGLVTLNVDGDLEEEVWIKIENKEGTNIFLDVDTVGGYKTKKNGSKEYTVGLKAGTYYINLSHTGNAKFDKYLNYTIQYEKRNDYEKEENNTMEKANPINMYETYNADISINDSDYFVFNNGDLGVVVSLKKGWVASKPYVVLYDEAGNLINPKNKEDVDGITNKFYFNNLSSGKYYVKVGNEGNSTSYSIKLDKYISGWVSENGKKYFYKDSNKVIGLQQIDNHIYFFDESGVMQTGWKSANGGWKYFDLDGTMKQGWLSYNGSWYFLNNNGDMVAGIGEINGSTYYFDDNGVMQTGWVNRGAWRYFNSEGVMQKGWLYQGGNWYYLNSSGNMVIGLNYINGSWHYFYNDGTYYGKIL